MALDIARVGRLMVLHLLAMAREGQVDFTMADIDRLSREVRICKVAPATEQYHVEDVARAGGIPAILGELLKRKDQPEYAHRFGPDAGRDDRVQRRRGFSV